MDWFGNDLTVEGLVAVIEQGTQDLPPGSTTEVMCHPGWVDASLLNISKYGYEREQELSVLTDLALLGRMELKALRPCSFPAMAAVARTA